ncbi:Metallo-hydrolase/oxidoreductase [Rozella allomycis CSF55]|uniref:Endoribonuclease YSH1 n=1 Tax=Rozella allomycis (strain CSF55) TaxID=988480 RepID=A0A4P9YPU9_ROZAC|nr:Metallo-hydrolase/oxidoreductase [Rozella allomycis CSF55]
MDMEEGNKRLHSDDTMTITPLGAGSEVGRSCHILSFKGKKIMPALPFFDEIECDEIDLVLVTHFHLDHAASLPYFMERTEFKGRVFMTHATKSIYKWLLSDYVKVSNISTESIIYTEQDLHNSYEKIEAVDYHQENEVNGIKFTAYNAGHVLGAAMFMIEIAGVKVLYTGDYSREEDRHLMAAEKPNGQMDIMICESTYGVQSHEPRLQRESRFTGLVHEIVGRGGRCLLPVFALGRAQELLLILDEYWQTHPELHSVPIYFASSLAKKCMTVYQTYINMMNERIRKQFTISNPFVFKHISNLKNMEHFEDIGPCVMMASPGMLQSGLSRELLELWCSDAKNGVIISGYSVEGTLAKHILNEPSEITSMNGSKLPLRMSVEYISFSAHVDFTQNSQFIDLIKPIHLVLVHGEANEMMRLKNALVRHYEDVEEKMEIHTPKNCETVELYFKGEKYAKVIGRKARKIADADEIFSGILVSKDFESYILDPEDLNEFTQVKTCSILQRQLLKLYGCVNKNVQ